MAGIFLDAIKERIYAGDRAGARKELQVLLQAEPDNVEAWVLLATLLDDPDEQIHCYQAILHLDPDNRQAAIWLDALTGQRPEMTPRDEGEGLQCPQCGGIVEIRFLGDLRDKRAVCPYCGFHVDLPDTYQRVRQTREHEQLPGGGSRTVESVEVEARSDHAPQGQPPASIPSLEELQDLVQEMSGDELDPGALSELPESGDVFFSGRRVVSTEVQPESEGLLGRVLGRLGLDGPDDRLRMTLDGSEGPLALGGPLNPEDIIELAGGPLAPEERRNCPKCDAVVSRDAASCPWCSEALSGGAESTDAG